MTEIETEKDNPVLILNNVSKSYGSRIILRNISLKLNAGDYIYIIGSNGSGKSTLLNLIRHEDVPDSGKIISGNFELDKLSKKNVPYYRRSIGYVMQNNLLIPHQTVRKNLTYPLEALGYSDEIIEQRYEDVLSIVGMYNHKNDNADDLSGGEQQLVSFAQVLISKPDILLVDEPTSNLSPALSEKMFVALDKISLMGTTVIDVTHSDEQITKHPHPLYYLNKGQLRPIKI